MRQSWVEVDLGAIQANAAAISAAVRPAALCAVVKADGYGHGDVPSAEAALAGGATWLAVALVEEGIRLREAGISAPVLVLSEPRPEDAAEVVEWSLTPTVYTMPTIEALAGATSEPLGVHLKVDTGMHRVGAEPMDLIRLARAVHEAPMLTFEGLCTHFPVADEDADFTLGQAAALNAARQALAAEGLEPRLVHAANSAGALYHEATRYDMVRVGLGIYGHPPLPPPRSSWVAGPPPPHSRPGGVELAVAMRVVSRVSLVRTLPAGARPSYGRRRPLVRSATIATVPIGYADGVSRRWGDIGGEVLIGGVRREFAGSVTMDQIVVDVGDDPVEVGDEAVILGRQGDEEITADEIAGTLGTISYEVLCGFGPRLPRRYSP